jgi:hypothetical protein
MRTITSLFNAPPETANVFIHIPGTGRTKYLPSGAVHEHVKAHVTA